MRLISYILLFLFFLVPIINAQDYLKITFFYYPKSIFIEQGKTNSSFVVLKNMYNETLYNIVLKFQLPAGIVVTQEKDGLEELNPDEKGSIKFNLTATSINNGTYDVTFWAESINQIDSNYIQSSKQTFTLIVIKNSTEVTTSTTVQPTINTTTTQISSTSTIEKEVETETTKRKINPLLAGLGLLSILIVIFIFMKK